MEEYSWKMIVNKRTSLSYTITKTTYEGVLGIKPRCGVKRCWAMRYSNTILPGCYHYRHPCDWECIEAKIVYWGGIEGSSEYSWIRIVKGKREKFNVKPSNPKIPLEEITDDMMDDDMGVTDLLRKMLALKIKGKVSIRRWFEGESKTSMACKILDSVIKK